MTDSQKAKVARIYELRKLGWSYLAIGEELGVSVDVARSVVRRGPNYVPDSRFDNKALSGEFRPKQCKSYWCDGCHATIVLQPCPACWHRALRAKKVSC